MEHLPPWLRNVPLPPRPASAAGAPATWLHDADDAAPQVDAGAGLPDWLRDLQSEVEDTPPVPPRPPAPAPREAAHSEAASDDVPDWLRDLEAEPPLPPATPTDRPTPFGATSWLSALGQDDAPPPAGEPSAEPPVEPPTTTSRIRMPVGATDWLRSIGQEPDVEEELARAERERSPAPDEDKAEIPDWLRDVSAEELAAEADSSPEAMQAPGSAAGDPPGQAGRRGAEIDAALLDETVAASDDVPDWLRDIVPADEMPGAARRPAGPPAWLDGDESAGDLDGPEWLRQFTGDAPSAPPPGGQSSDAVPDWLRAADDPPPGRAPEAGRDEPPSWLRGADEPPAAPPALDADDAPAWLRGADEPLAARGAPVDEPPAARGAPAGGDDVPSWLREADEPSAARGVPIDEPPAARGAPAGGDDVPSWLREADEPPAARGAPAGGDDVPSWLREDDVAPSGRPPEGARPPAEPAPAADADDVPAWLRELEPGAKPAPTPSPSVAPTWLHEDFEEAAPAAPAPLNEPEEPAQPSRPPADLPPWLTADEPAAPAPARPGTSDLALPSWLRGVSDEPAAPPAPPPRGADDPPRRGTPPGRSRPADSEGDDFLRGADLPSWLRPPEPERASDSATAQTFDWLTRLGASEVEEDAEGRAPVAAATPLRRPAYQRTAEQAAAAGLLGQLARAPYPEAAPAPAAATPSRWQRVGLDRVLYLLFALALLVGLIAPQLAAPLQPAAPAAPGAAELGGIVDGLTSEDVVLVAYEWGAQRSAELRPLEQAVMQRLAANRVKLILVSTDLQGALLSFDQREPLRAAGYNVEPDGREFGGRDYVLLGYRPGGELALRAIARDLRGELRSDFAGRDATQGLLASNIQGIRDVAMILVMADQPQDVQAWMEQVRPAAGDVPIAFLLPQEAQPLVQPYLSLDGVYHIAGLQGALAFAAGAPNADQAALARSAGQLSLAVVVFVVLLLLGAAGAALSRSRRRRGDSA